MPDSLDPIALAHWRMSSVGLIRKHADTAGDVTKGLLASQSQDYRIALWSLAQRTGGLTESEVEAEFAEGTFLRTHVLRPTWHFVHRDDLGLLLDLTAPRVHVLNGMYYRREGVDPGILTLCHALMTDALAGGNHLTREDLAGVFARGGVEASRFRLAYILMHAELEQVICSGRPRDKSQTYALFDERAPAASTRDRDAALAELVFRYFSSHGPATVKDLRWWSSLTIAEIKIGLEAVADRLTSETIGDYTFWFTNPPPESGPASPDVRLMQTFDEYIVGFQDTRGVIDAGGLERSGAVKEGLALSPIFVDGQVAGRWKRTMRSGSVTIDAYLYRPLDDAEEQALATEASAYGAYVGLEPELVVSLL